MRSQVEETVATISATVRTATDAAGTRPIMSIGERSANQRAMAIVAESPRPMTWKNGPSRPNGMASAPSTAKGMTIIETIGMAARLVNSPSDGICWKCQAA